MTATEQWLEKRKQFVTSTDAPVIYRGRCYDTTVRDIYHDKRGEPREINPNIPRDFRCLPKDELTRDACRGQVFERLGILWFEEIQGLEVAYPRNDEDRLNGFFKVGKIPWQSATFDGLIYKNGKLDAAVEIKWPRLAGYKKVASGKIPEEKIIQVQHQLMVLPVDVIYLSVNHSDHWERPIITPITRDEAIQTELLRKEKLFRESILAGVDVPAELLPVDTFDGCKEKGEVTAVEEALAWRDPILSLRTAREIREMAETEEAEAIERIQGLMSTFNLNAIEGHGAKIYWREQAGRKTFDQSAFKEAHPELAAEMDKFMKQSKASRPFRPYFTREG